MFQAYTQLVNRFVHHSVEFVFKFYNFILAALMVVYSLEELYQVHIYSEFFTYEWYEIGRYLILLLGGSIILLDRNRNLLRSVGIYALSLGGYRFLSAAPKIHAGSMEGVLYLAITILAINLMISGRSFLRGVSRNRISLILCTLVLFLINLSTIVFMIHLGGTLNDVIQTMPGVVIMCVLYLFYIGLLDSEVLCASDVLAIHNETLNKIRRTQYTDPESTISEEDALVLSRSFEDRSDWAQVLDGGPVECEYRFRMKNVDGVSEILVQKWVGSDELYFTISDHLDGTLIQAHRFSATSALIHTDESACRWLLVFGKRGVCMRLMIEEPEPDPSAATATAAECPENIEQPDTKVVCA